MPQLDLDPEAVAEVRRAYRWYLARAGQSVASSFLDALRAARRKIETNPMASAKHAHGTRVVRLKRYPYLIVFRILPSGDLFGYAVAHARRKRAYWKRRLP